MPRRPCVAGLCALSLCALPAPLALAGGTSTYDFTINTPLSGLSASPSIGISTAGTLIGNWNPDTNPSGTRTKPGINPFAPFGDTENLPVALTLGAQLGGPIDTAPTGSFRLQVAEVPGGGGVLMSGFQADLLAGGPVNLPLTLSLLYEGFRTRSPSAIFPGGFPLEIPLGGASLSSMAITQVGPGAPGIMIQTGPGQYDFVLAPIVELSATFDFFGTAITIPGTPVPYPIAGELVFSGGSAVLSSVHPVEFEHAFAPAFALPGIPFDLPTILPPGGTAGLVLDLTLGEILSSFSGTHTLVAGGTIVPAPSAALALAALGLAGSGRRRRG